MPGLPLDAAAEAQLVDRPSSLDGVKTFSAPLNEGNALIGIRPERLDSPRLDQFRTAGVRGAPRQSGAGALVDGARLCIL